MCGIAGVISNKPLTPDEIASLNRINRRLIHRGPDSGRIYAGRNVGLAMRRLSIIDLEGGQQPIANEDRTVTIICNGEVYNHRDLRRELVARGHSFRSHSDVETILHLYEDKGEDCVTPLRGMYAFAIWDERSQRLLLGRDRLGEKPLFLYRVTESDGSEKLWFSSELRALIPLVPRRDRQISPTAVLEYLTFQYTLDPHSLVEGIVQLPPGHLLTASPNTPHGQTLKYWELSSVPPHEEKTNPVEVTRDTLDIACARMATADVPVGVALSGGIDSSLVAAIAAKHYPGQINAFSVGYTGRPPSDERRIAERFSRSIGIPFREIELDLDQVAASFPQLVGAMDLPIADIAAFGYYAVARAAREARIPVLLSGIGGDEFFWGYDWVRDAVGRASTSPRASTSTANMLRRLLLRHRSPSRGRISIFSPHPELRLAADISVALLSNSSLSSTHWLSTTTLPDVVPANVAVSQSLNATWLVGNCLSLLDQMSMAHSIEMRAPFLDIDLVTQVTAMRRAGLTDWQRPHKWLLMQAYGDLLPEEIKHRKKQGFTPPTQDWMRSIVARYGDALGPGCNIELAALADGKKLRKIAHGAPLSFQYKLCVLEIWLSRILEADRMAQAGSADSMDLGRDWLTLAGNEACEM